MPYFSPQTMRAAVAGVAMMIAVAASGQARPASDGDRFDSRVDIYGGYGAWDPFHSDIYDHQYPLLYNPNATASVAFYFTRHLGVQAEGEYFSLGRTLDRAGNCNAVPCSPTGQRIYTFEGGAIFRYPIGRFVPFVHALGGGERLSGPYNNPLTLGWGVTGGGGVDIILPYFHSLFAVRPVQADYQFAQVSYGPLILPAGTNGGFAGVNALKVSGGLTLRLGARDMDHSPSGGLMMDCSASPSSIYPGDPVQVSARPTNLKEKRPASYAFTSTGGVVTGSEGGASITTAGLAPGSYSVTGTVTQGRARAQCGTSFTVQPYEPPTVSCQANPASVQTGSVTAITAQGVSPSNRTLSYSFAADYGTITAVGNRASLSTAGLPPTTIHVTCNVVDDLGKTASGGTSVAVTNPQTALLPPLADTQALCGVTFDRDRRRPVRVDNEAKACLDDIALTLQRQNDAKIVIVGNYGRGEDRTQGAERSLNVRQYLTDEKGIDPARIEVRYGVGSGRNVENVLVPAGTAYSNAKTTAFEPSSVRRVGQAYGKPGGYVGRRHRHVVRRRHRHHGAATGEQVPAPPA